ncbi:MAG: hypothetical protein U0228_11735 [Myxococcaceae bacterium]
MTTTSDSPTVRPPGLFTRAEAGSRQVVMQVGLGAVAFVVGSIFGSGATTRIAERLGPVESDLVDWVLTTLLSRTWLFVFVPLFGYAIGRFTQISPVRFALTASLSGETFAVLVLAGINGFDFLIVEPKEVVARLVTLFIGMVLTAAAVRAGRKAHDAAELRSLAEAQRRKAEYAEYLAKVEGPKT